MTVCPTINNCTNNVILSLTTSHSEPPSVDTFPNNTSEVIASNIKCMFPNLSTPSHEAISAVVTKAYDSSDLDLDIKAAVEWGDGFKFPELCHTSDIKDLDRLDGDLELLIRERQTLMSPRRFNSKSVDAIQELLPLFKEIPLLRSLVEGIEVITDPEFIADPTPPKPSPIYTEVCSAVDKMWYELYLAGFILLFPTKDLQAHQRRKKFLLSYSRAGWAKKRGKPKGRPTTNLSYDNRKGGLINTASVKETIRSIYGDIHPAQLPNKLTEWVGTK